MPALEDRPPVEEVQSFKMPPISLGMNVAYFRGAQREASHMIATVVKVSNSGRAVVLRTAAGQPVESVRHVDDPKLKFSEDAAQNGSWDYTPEYKDNQARFARLQEQIESLRAEVKLLQDKKANSK